MANNSPNQGKSNIKAADQVFADLRQANLQQREKDKEKQKAGSKLKQEQLDQMIKAFLNPEHAKASGWTQEKFDDCLRLLGKTGAKEFFAIVNDIAKENMKNRKTNTGAYKYNINKQGLNELLLDIRNYHNFRSSIDPYADPKSLNDNR